MIELLNDWVALRRHATELRRVIRANRCTESFPDEIGEGWRVDVPGMGRCTEEQPDAPDEWCEGCQRSSVARAELSAIKVDIRKVERKMMRAAPTQPTEDSNAR